MKGQFQFHFGSIGSRSNSYKNARVRSFNSTLVRLEDITKNLSGKTYKFQFHFGSIGSHLGSPFNSFINVSIPLWFDWKNMEHTSLFHCNFRFNSTLVRLEARRLYLSIFCRLCFNSTLVRLEVRRSTVLI